MKDYKKLQIWQDAMELYKSIIPILGVLRAQHLYGLLDQLEGSTGSVADNIAEGQGRNGNKEFLYFLGIAKGSLQECDSQLNRVKLLNIHDETAIADVLHRADRLQARIQTLINYLKENAQ
jgi:four helix bundle protein